VKLHGLVADGEAFGNRLVRKPLRQQLEHLHFAGRQRFFDDVRRRATASGWRGVESQQQRVGRDVRLTRLVEGRTLTGHVDGGVEQLGPQRVAGARRTDQKDAHGKGDRLPNARLRWTVPATAPVSIDELQQRLADQHYVSDRGLAVSLFIALRLGRPLFLEGEAGVGKTSLAAAIAAALSTDLIRLQCYEGLDISHAVYEWDYPRQLLELRLLEASGSVDRATAHDALYSDAFLLKRPLLQAIDPARSKPAVLLIDEIDRADEEFEGYLLELLAEFQVTIPEIGTVRATERPLVILTSNRTREVHDALKRRCLYQWLEYPSFEKELEIVRVRVPSASAQLTAQVAALAQELRTQDLYKTPGVSETIDWVSALAALGHDRVDEQGVRETLGVVLKAREDVEAMGGRVSELLARASARVPKSV